VKKIKIGLSTTEKLLSKMIRVVQGTDFSHSWIGFYVLDNDVIYESKGLNSYIINKKHVGGETIEEYEVEVSDELHTEIMQFILGDIGVAYAWKQLFGFLVVKCARMIGIKMKNPWPQSGKVCAESCGEILVRFFGVTPDVDYDDMDLVWLKEKLIQYPQFKKIKG
jgi:hypothetical protein